MGEVPQPVTPPSTHMTVDDVAAGSKPLHRSSGVPVSIVPGGMLCGAASLPSLPSPTF